MRFGLLVGMVLALSARAFAEDEKTSADYWREAGMTLELLVNPAMIDAANCDANNENFSGCYYALTAIAANSQPMLAIVPASVVADPELEFPAVTGKLNDYFVTVPFSAAPKNVSEMRKSRVRDQLRRKKVDAALIALRGSLKDDEVIDFPALARNLLIQTGIPESDRALAIAEGYNAYIQSSDPHAHIDPTAQLKDGMKKTGEQVVGIGAVLSEVFETIVVKDLIPDSPAARGLQKNDILQWIDGKSTKGETLQQVVNRVRGELGSEVVLKILRDKSEIELRLIRAPVIAPNVQVQIEDLPGGKYLYVRLESFMKETACEIMERDILTTLEDNPGIVGLILDMRGNPGGLMDQGVCVGALFLGDKIIVKAKNIADGSYRVYNHPFGEEITPLPMATLINAGSASASEIVSGALQFYDRSWIVGETSYGKGSVQVSRDLKPGITIFETKSRFYQPSGFTNQGVGIVPEFSIGTKPDATEDERFAVREMDTFTNALPPEGPKYVTDRGDEIARIEKCRLEKKRAETDYVSKRQLDYQLSVAAEVLACEAGR